MRQSINKVARMCAKCTIDSVTCVSNGFPKICSKAYIAGFKKGYKVYKDVSS